MKRVHRRIAAAAIAALALVITVVVAFPARAEDLPRLGGVITDRATGEPLSGACAEVYSVRLRVQQSCTGADGRYGFDAVSVSTALRIKVTRPGHAETWWPTAPDFANAGQSAFGPAPVVRDISMLALAGTVSGQVTDPESQPAGFVTVIISSASVRPGRHGRSPAATGSSSWAASPPARTRWSSSERIWPRSGLRTLRPPMGRCRSSLSPGRPRRWTGTSRRG